MRSTMRCLTAAAFAAVALGLTTAQDPPRRPGGFGGPGGPGGFGGGMGMGGPTMLLMSKEVQEEIKITDDQKAKLREWAKDNASQMREKMQAAMKDIPRDEMRTKLPEVMAAMSQETYKELATVLDEQQVKRVKQIDVQNAGLRAFTQPDVVAALKLTDDQKASLREIGEDMRKDMQDLGERPDRSKVAALQKEGMEKVTKVLNEDQKTAWKELTGEPFDTSKLGGGFGGRGGPGGGPPGGRRPGGTNNN